MKIILLANGSSIHTVQWANVLSDAGNEIHVVSQHSISTNFNSKVFTYKYPYLGVLGYFVLSPFIKKLIYKIKPDIINAHYASGYGTIGRLVNYKPLVLSIWGSDVYDFPYKSPLHLYLLKKNLLSASIVASTSHSMAMHTKNLCNDIRNLQITPFGVHSNAFSYLNINNYEYRSDVLIIGTVKSLEHVYGIDILIFSFSLLLDRVKNNKVPRPFKEVRLRLVGDGSQKKLLLDLVNKLKISEYVDFIGHVPHASVPNELSKMDIYVALSRQESFGVSIIEAGAASLPVVVSNTGGPSEIVIDNVTGFIVPIDNTSYIVDKLFLLLSDRDLRLSLGAAGRLHVSNNYDWNICLRQMLKIYNLVL